MFSFKNMIDHNFSTCILLYYLPHLTLAEKKGKLCSLFNFKQEFKSFEEFYKHFIKTGVLSTPGSCSYLLQFSRRSETGSLEVAVALTKPLCLGRLVGRPVL